MFSGKPAILAIMASVIEMGIGFCAQSCVFYIHLFCLLGTISSRIGMERLKQPQFCFFCYLSCLPTEICRSYSRFFAFLSLNQIISSSCSSLFLYCLDDVNGNMEAAWK